ncbi:alpha/beta hydrolase [Bacillus thuringiensis serovar roskildiensis]|uniref:Alpha/beta hydrolase n=1 Tax=Bacillus thuringiensis serovar sooncheon TaxID=180891 RepID=A0A9Q5SNA1_BACTU|nr:alpha/beta hydrolase [Bacillus thuringiensis]OTW73306.1 alpha/beta hydrolase [Bacillus thuringiensis serovar coreanensis]OTX50907.1 alpha/beta hydrolase [Bacillus thuringiensis serovar sooncheon]OTX56751.1 alpha/beta hydrolase [Bacillus thuringiensis serovar guiyangiensis]OTX71161.1 alpha/beta hydrolase [Bacillus thuringiensis serovar roskildiensis]
MNHFFVAFGEYEASVCEWGDKSNPQIICFHGLGSTKLSFIEIAELLKDKFHIVSFDLPGHGKTPSFGKDEDYGASHLTKWVVALLEQLGKETFHIVAHSWGASVALHYAAECTEKVNKMVLLDGGYHHGKMNADYFANLYKGVKEGECPPRSLEEEITHYEKDFDEYIFDSKEAFIQSEKMVYSRWSPLIERAVYDLMREEDYKVKWHATGDTARGVIKFQYTVYRTLESHKIKSDILLLYCDLPHNYLKIRELQIAEFKKHIDITTKLYTDIGHLMHWDRPEEIAENVLHWFI